MPVENEARTENQIQDTRANAIQRYKDSMTNEQDARDIQTLNELSEMHNKFMGRETEANKNVVDAAAEVAPDPKRAYGEAGRTMPASLMDARYRTLPKWQQAFRTPDVDMLVARYFRALAHKNHAELARIHEDARHMRAGDLLEGASAAGAPFDGSAGQLLPLPVANYINLALYRQARFRALANTTTTTTGASLRIPRQSAISSSAWEGESDIIAAGEPAVAGELNLVLQKLATLADISNETLEDEVFGVASWLIDDVTAQIAETEDSALYATGVGSGSDQPNGFELNDVIVTMTTSNTNILPTATQAANHFLVTDIDYPTVVALFFALPEAERRNAIWSGPDTVMQILSLIVDGSGRPIFNMANDAGAVVGDAESSAQTGTILGRPVHNLPGAEGTSDSNDNRLYFFNPRRTYAILERAGLRVEASREALFSTDMTQYRFIRRIDGGVIGNAIAARKQYRFVGGITGVGTPA